MTVDVSRYPFDKQKITASKAMLNELCCIMDAAVVTFRNDGCDALAKSCEEMCTKIYEQLKAAGYYD